jgi:prepilin-type N-terminal cleavage/methylation domain-containing protein
MKRRRGFSLIELMTATAIIGVLTSVLLPAVQQAREAARATQCRSNLKQIGIALHQYEEVHGRYPLGGLPMATDSWSVHGRLLPFLDQGNVHARMHFERGWTHPLNLAAAVPTMEMPVYRCGSDPNSNTLCQAEPDEGLVRPVSYGFNYGSWLVYDPATGQGGDGVFYPVSSLGPHQISDGLSNTLAAAEIKAFQPLFVNTVDPGPAVPTSPGQICGWAGAASFELGPGLNDNGGHTEWCDASVHDTGFTTVFTPNRIVNYVHSDGRTYDVDFNSRQEGSSATQKTYAAVTTRSFHPGLVHVLMMDGAVRAIQDGVAVDVWRAIGTRAGRETGGSL